MVSEFDGQGRIKIKDRMIVEPKFFGAYALFSIQKEWIESGKDDLTREFGEHLVNDTVLNPLQDPNKSTSTLVGNRLKIGLGRVLHIFGS